MKWICERYIGPSTSLCGEFGQLGDREKNGFPPETKGIMRQSGGTPPPLRFEWTAAK